MPNSTYYIKICIEAMPITLNFNFSKGLEFISYLFTLIYNTPKFYIQTSNIYHKFKRMNSSSVRSLRFTSSYLNDR